MHVDFLETDWARGVERLAVRVWANGQLEIKDTADESFWRDRLERPVEDPFGKPIVPADNSVFFLELLARKYEQGTYVHALGPHDDAHCPFVTTSVVPMRELEVHRRPAP